MDELVQYLHSAQPENVIIGKDNCNLLILGDGLYKPTQIKLLLIAFGCDSPITNVTIDEMRRKYKTEPIFKQLFDSGRKMAEIAGIPLVISGYQKCTISEIDSEYMDNMKFMVEKIGPEDKNGCPTVFNSEEFVKYLYDLMKITCCDAGTHKAKNKSIADAFHAWSRAKLSPRVVKQDFDAIYNANGKFAMIEVKRSPAKSVENWTPYTNDIRNYDIQNRFSKILKSPFYTFHHCGGTCDDDTKVGCFRISDINIEDKNNWIQYRKSVTTAKTLINILKESTLNSGKV